MRASLFSTAIAGLLLVMLAQPSFAASGDYDEKTSALQTQSGLFDIHTSRNGGVVLASLPAADSTGVIARYIHATSLRSGLGSNPVGLDRGLWDFGRLISLQRIGDKIVITHENTTYRAESDNADERSAVRESFARSVLWSGEIVAEAKDGRLLVDLSDFLTGDMLGVAAQLKRAGQGNFQLDTARSFIGREQLAFPDNVELEATLTFTSAEPGQEVRATAPDARAVTMVMHHSFVRLPGDGYQVRYADPRAAAIDLLYYDFAQPLAAALPVAIARRFRLQREDADATSGPVVKPIVFYVDRGAPEPIRSALIEGAAWWADAFEAAGFEGGYRVELLPEGAHPLDVRYNVVQWVHRQTRGWSYGGGIADPRTGEMLKGNVILGSQRVRQDRMIFEGLAGRQNTGSGSADDPLQISLARIRQLAAHEVGHALGFEHNMGASMDDRASVMDYPAPLVTVGDDGGLDFSRAYGVGVGPWDKFTVAWLYSQFPSSVDERDALNTLVDDVYASGLRFVADRHSRPVSAAHPVGSLWDNGSDPVAFLNETLRVREIALARFGLDSLAAGQPVSDLQTVFAPIYLYHRYQTLAAAKLIGGINFDYALAGTDIEGVTPVSNDDQRRALAAVLNTVSVDTLHIDERIRRLMLPPINPGEPILGRERVDSGVAPMFDPWHAASAASRLTFSVLLDSARLGRVALQHADDADYMGVTAVLAQAADAVFSATDKPELQFAIQWQYLAALMRLDQSGSSSPVVRAASRAALSDAAAILSARRSGLAQSQAQRSWMATVITRYLDKGEIPESGLPDMPEIPPGSPIGAGATSCWHCDSEALLGAY